MNPLRFFSGQEKYQKTLKRRWLLVLVGCCSILTGELFLFQCQNPIYRASAQGTLESNKPNYTTPKITKLEKARGLIPSHHTRKSQPRSSSYSGFFLAYIYATAKFNYSLVYWGILVIVLLGVVMIIHLLKVVDQSLKTMAELHKILDYNWLGVIPTIIASFGSKSSPHSLIPQIIVPDNSVDSFCASYLTLQSNLNFLNKEQNIKVIATTSSVAKEGKSSITANLAYTMAHLGKKVLIIDSNLHSPSQHCIWCTHNNYGLSNNIVEKADPRLTIQTIRSNLDLVTAGTMKTTYVQLLRSPIMKQLINFWGKLYDCILIDSPALNVNTEAKILGSITDGILLVVRPSLLAPRQAALTKESLKQSGQKILGMVLNNINLHQESQNYFNHILVKQLKITLANNKLPKPARESWCNMMPIAPKLQNHYVPQGEISQCSTDYVVLQQGLSDRKKLKDLARDELETIIVHLQKNLQQSIQLVREQEDELLLKRHKLRKLVRKVNIANQVERNSLENRLQEEQEITHMLNQTLIGQRRNLQKKSKLLLQYWQILQKK